MQQRRRRVSVGHQVAGSGPVRPPGRLLALNDLLSVTTRLQQMIGDEVLFRAGTEQARRRRSG